MATFAQRPYNTVAQQNISGCSGPMMSRSSLQRVPASSPVRSQAVTPMTPMNSTRLASPQNAPANGVVRQTSASYHSILGAAAGAPAPSSTHGQVPLTARGQPLFTARGQASFPELSPRHEVTRQQSAYVPPTCEPSPRHEVTRQQSAYLPSPRPEVPWQPTAHVPPTYQPSPRHEVTRQQSAHLPRTCLPSPQQWPAYVPPATEVYGSQGYPELAQTDCVPWSRSARGAPTPRVVGSPCAELQGSPSPRTLTRVQSATELPTPRQGFDSVPILKKSPSVTSIPQTKDLITDSLTNSTCSPVTPRTPGSSEEEMVRGILAQAEKARQRATRALETCKDRLPTRRSLLSRPNKTCPTVLSPVVKDKWPMEDLVAGIDLVTYSSGVDTPPKVETPPMRRIAPAFQEPLSPLPGPAREINVVEGPPFQGLCCGSDSIRDIKQACATPPWPQRLAKGAVTGQIVRPYSYALRDVEMELESLNTDLLTSHRRKAAAHSNQSSTKDGISSALQVYNLPEVQASKEPKTSAAMEDFESWRASLLGSAFK